MTDKPVALVLGAMVYRNGHPSAALRRRAEHACRLFHKGTVGQIIACGGLGGNAPSQAEVIRRICLDQNVPEIAIALEDRSETTRENLTFALPYLGGEAPCRVVIVTDRYHSRRALMAARRLGMRATASCPRPDGVRLSRLVRGYLREIPATLWYFFTLPRR